MERTDIDVSEIEDIGLDDAFQNWLSTTVDTINSNCDMLEMAINPLITPTVLSLTRCDTSATSNIALSNDFIKFMEKLVNKITMLDAMINKRIK